MKPPKKNTKRSPKKKPERIYTHTEVGYILNEFYWLMRHNNNDPTKAFRYYDNIKRRKNFTPSIGPSTNSPIK